MFSSLIPSDATLQTTLIRANAFTAWPRAIPSDVKDESWLLLSRRTLQQGACHLRLSPAEQPAEHELRDFGQKEIGVCAELAQRPNG
jgi:hypothetical protein